MIKGTCKQCRREGVSLCGREKCALKRRPFAPGVHGPTARKPRLSGYGTQLREKQKAKRLYGIMERQFRNYFEKATQKKGDTGIFLVQQLETRLDNVVYRLGFAMTRRQARQMVSHGFFDIDGAKVNIPSYQCSIGEVISVRESKKGKGLMASVSERVAKHEVPNWLTLDPAKLSGKILGMPEGADLASVFDPKLIVEFYSRT